jgi:hypothetical protein
LKRNLFQLLPQTSVFFLHRARSFVLKSIQNTPSSSGEGEIIESHVENNCESTFEDTVVVDVHMSSSDPEPMVKNELEEVVIPPRTPRLSKRRLCLMDAVVVPSLASLGIKRRRDVGEETPTKVRAAGR